MIPTDENLPTLDNEQLDLLVDGELPGDQRRHLLATLDDVPDGWRRCALAFLEGQSWRGDLRAIAPGAESESHPSPAGRRRSSSGGGWKTLLAMAASFLIALGLGLLLRDAWQSGVPGSAGPEGVAVTPQLPEGSDIPQGERPDGPKRPETPASPYRMVTVALDGGPQGGGQSIRLPARESDHLDEAWLNGFPSPIPADLLNSLRQSGHQVQQQRQLLPLPMEGGGHLVVPFDEVEFRYSGPPRYQ